MSNVIPIVSSSPPPMDDGGGFDQWDDDDDDFGGFTGADDSILSTPGKPSDMSTPAVGTDNRSAFMFTGWTQSGATDIQGNNQSTTDSGISDFANFSSFDGRANSAETEPSNSDNENRPNTIELDDSVNDEPKDNEGEVVKHPLTDSGLYSSDVSPLQHSDSSGLGHKNHSDSESIDELQLDRTSTENVSDRISLNSEYISSEDTNDPLANEQVLQHTEYLDSGSISEPKLDAKNGTESNLSENLNNSNRSSPVDESLGQSMFTAENIPQLKNSSHSLVSDGEESQPSVQLDAHGSATNTAHSGATNTAVCSDKEVVSDTNEMTEEQSQCDNVEQSLDKPGNFDTEQDSDFVNKASNKTESQLTINDSYDLQQRSNCDSETKVDNDSNHLNQSIDSMPLRTKHGEKSQKDEHCEFHDGDSGQNLGKDTSDSENHKEISDTSGSCSIDKRGSQTGSDLKVDTEETNKTAECETKLERTSSDSSIGEKEICLAKESVESEVLKHTSSQNQYEETHARLDCDTNVQDAYNANESCDFNALNSEDVAMQTVDKNDLDDFSTFKSESASEHISDENEFDDFNAFESVNTGEPQKASGETEFDDFTAFNIEKANEEEMDNFGKLSGDVQAFKSDETEDASLQEFGAFSKTGNSFANFGPEGADKDETSEKDGDWAAFSEPQISQSLAASEMDDDEWASFDGDESQSFAQKEESSAASAPPVHPSLQNMSKQEKVTFAVTGCFSSLISIVDSELRDSDQDVLNVDSKTSDSEIWSNMRGLQTTNALGYHWSQSQWNNHLYCTLKVDTRNILFGHKKSSSMPIFASNLTMLEPTKGPTGSGSKSQEALIDTSKPDDSQVYTQDSFPPAHFDWSSSGLTNPLEAANKTLNLDFLIQESEQNSGKSHALESEFLGPDDSTGRKPASIQPLENILANLKSSSTFKPTSQNEDLSQEASKIIHSLPNLSFMKTKVLMFPIKQSE